MNDPAAAFASPTPAHFNGSAPFVKSHRVAAAPAALLLVCGLLLRLYFVRYHPFTAGDSVLYLDIARNWVDAHVYGLSTDTAPRPTLIRLPGYPLVLAVVAWMFPRAAAAGDGAGTFAAVRLLQVLADLGTCVLVALPAQRCFGRRAGLAALALGALCPFLANYAAVPLTETLVLLSIAMAYAAAVAWRTRPRLASLLVAALAMGCGMLLRPDGVLLTVAVLPLFFLPRSGAKPWQMSAAVLCATLAATPLIPWTIRNAIVFHVFQPLAPRSATDPGEPVPIGFPRWYRTFAVDFASTEDAYWNYPENPVDPADLPARAYDNLDQRRRAGDLLRQAAVARTLQPSIEAGFLSLAAERIRAHPLRYYVGLPVARFVNMLMHPRVEMLPVDTRWWRFRLHPAQTVFAALYGLLNLLYLGLAAAGLRRAWRASPALAGSMVAFVLLRSALLLTLDNAEQRYTMQFFPVVFFLASAWFADPPRDPGVD